ncbi:MAG: ATP-grasp domain-containing protein [Gemmatimonadales bacterium]
MTVRIAFVTSQALHDLTESDRLAAAALRGRGAVVVPAVWTDPSVEWGAFDQVIIRSPWDYYRHRDRFVEWIGALDNAGVTTRNPTAILRWNLDKSYLRELDVPQVPTEWIERGAAVDLGQVIRDQGWGSAVVKPTVSGGATDTWITTPATAAADHARAAPILARCGLMIQRFMPEIRDQGEWSLLFFRGRFSHATIKRPTKGDFRVQIEHGGSTHPATPTDALLAQAQRVVESVGAELLYARVDGLDVDGQLQLMELEVLEPDLFLQYSDGAADRFAEAVLAGE